MKQSHKAKSLIFLFLINFVCVIRASGCEDDIAEEFNNDEPLNDFLHAFLHIKQSGAFWNGDFNVETYCGDGSILNSWAQRYYFDMIYVVHAQYIYLPHLLTSEDYCGAFYVDEKIDCKDALAEIGCGSIYDGFDCIRNLYFRWKIPEAPVSIPGTEDITDEVLYMVICRGSNILSTLSEAEFMEAISSGSDIVHSLSDENLVNDFFGVSNGVRNRKHRSRSGRGREFESNILHEARVAKYGISDVPYADLCEEYIRRKNLPKPYASSFGMYIHDIFKHYLVGNQFESREDYCAKFLP